ncbi:hypothetical protein DL769_005693 [Monosporascus sp. CRB-8-3]|nr:hypothetical protein DL769_005693 [Monosporascus sp. CRB-8-3]
MDGGDVELTPLYARPHRRPPDAWINPSDEARNASPRPKKKQRSLPTLSEEEAEGELCVPSERLIIRPDPDVECDQLRAQVFHLQEKVEVLRSRFRDAQLQLTSIEEDTGRGRPIYLNTPLASDRPAVLLNHDETQANVEVGYRGRILLPTFARLGSSATCESGFLSSPWRLWDGVTTAGGLDNVSNVGIQSLSEGQRRDFVDIFFAKRWPQFPVLHQPTFLEQHYAPFVRGETTNKLSPFLVNIILAIGSSEKTRRSAPSQEIHQSFFQAAVQSLCDVLGANDLDCIQCLILLCMYGTNEPQSVNLWYTAGLILRLAIGIDLHRRESLINKNFMEREMIKRLFWSVYTMDRSISIAMGRPLGIQDADITMPLPLCLTDEMLLAQASAGGSPSGGDTSFVNLVPDPRDLSTFLNIIQLRRINASIYKTLYSAGDANLTGESIGALRSQYYGQLNEWLVSTPRYVNPVCMNQTPEWFQIAYHQAIMNLYRPSHASPLCTINAIRLCADSSISLITNYSALYAKNRITYTFVALTSLFMAAVTMLYCLRASATLRSELTREVTEWNIRMCTTLLRDMSNGEIVGERSAQIIQRLGDATLAVFGAQSEPAHGVIMIVLCAYDAYPLREIQHPQMGEAIIIGCQYLKRWEKNPRLRMRVEKTGNLMRVKVDNVHGVSTMVFNANVYNVANLQHTSTQDSCKE